MKRRVAAYISLLLLVLLLCACGNGNDFNAGAPMTPEELAALRASLQGKEATGEEQVPEVVYWLGGGSVYHSDADCYHIKEKPNVASGTVEAAMAAGKQKPCGHCTAD